MQNKVKFTRDFYISSYGYDAKSTILQTAGYYKDHAESCERNAKQGGDKTSGYLLRKEMIELSKVWQFGTSLHIDFLDSSKPLPPGVNMTLKLHRNNDDFVIIKNDDKEYKIKLLKLGVEFRKIDYMPAKVARDIMRFENGEEYIMPFNKTRLTTRVIPQGISSFSTPEIYRGPLPQQLIIGFVKHSAYNADPKLNPYIFENLGIKSLVFKVNGRSHPSTEYRPDFANNKCTREYIHMHDALGIRRLNSGLGINQKDFAKNNCFFVLDLSSDQCNNARKYHSFKLHTLL